MKFSPFYILDNLYPYAPKIRRFSYTYLYIILQEVFFFVKFFKK